MQLNHLFKSNGKEGNIYILAIEFNGINYN